MRKLLFEPTKRKKLRNKRHSVENKTGIMQRVLKMRSGPGSSVGTATDYGLDGPGIESRWGARFSAPVQTGPGAYPATCTMGTGSFQGVKSGRGVTLREDDTIVSKHVEV
jgi:hypothetical protein